MRLQIAEDLFVSDAWLAEATGAHRITIARWRATRCYPRPVILLARVATDGELGVVHPPWTGWRISHSTGELVPPPDTWSRYAYTPAALLALPLVRARVGALEGALAAIGREFGPLEGATLVGQLLERGARSREAAALAQRLVAITRALADGHQAAAGAYASARRKPRAQAPTPPTAPPPTRG